MMAGNSPSWYFEKSGFNVFIFFIETQMKLIEADLTDQSLSVFICKIRVISDSIVLLRKAKLLLQYFYPLKRLSNPQFQFP